MVAHAGQLHRRHDGARRLLAGLFQLDARGRWWREVASIGRSDECPPSLKVLWLRGFLFWRAQFLPIVRLELALKRLILSDSAPIDPNGEIVLD